MACAACYLTNTYAKYISRTIHEDWDNCENYVQGETDDNWKWDCVTTAMNCATTTTAMNCMRTAMNCVRTAQQLM